VRSRIDVPYRWLRGAEEGPITRWKATSSSFRNALDGNPPHQSGWSATALSKQPSKAGRGSTLPDDTRRRVGEGGRVAIELVLESSTADHDRR